MRSSSADHTTIGLVGAGGFGRECLPLVRRAAAALEATGGSVSVSFVEEDPHAASVNGIEVISFEAFCSTPGKRLFNVAIADSVVRERIAAVAVSRGAEPLSLSGASTIIGDASSIADGAILSEQTMVTANASVGRFFHGNIYSYVAHDCVIGDFVTFAPSVKCNGRVHIDDHAYIGTGAMFREGSPDAPLRIGRGAMVGMGAVVLNDVPPFAVVAGIPAKVIKMRDEF